MDLFLVNALRFLYYVPDDERPFDSGLLTVVTIIVIVLIILSCALAMLSSLLIIAKPDGRKDKEIEIAGNNSQGLSRAVLDGNKLLLQKANGVNQMNLDVITFAGNKKKKHSYELSFSGDFASIDLDAGTTDVKLIVLAVDGMIINKKKIGYPNNIALIVSSALILVGVGIIPLLNAFYHNGELDDPNIGYGILFYVVPFVIGAILAVVNFLISKLITKSFNKGGR